MISSFDFEWVPELCAELEAKGWEALILETREGIQEFDLLAADWNCCAVGEVLNLQTCFDKSIPEELEEPGADFAKAVHRGDHVKALKLFKKIKKKSKKYL